MPFRDNFHAGERPKFSIVQRGLDRAGLGTSPTPLPTVEAKTIFTAPVERDWVYNWPWQDAVSGGSLTLPGPLTQTYAEIYQSQLWVATLVDTLSHGIGRLPLKVYQRGPGDRRDRVRDTPLANLLARPYSRLTPTGFKQRIVSDLAVYGNALLVKVARRETDVPDALVPVSPVGWWLDDEDNYRRRLRTGEEKVYQPWQVVHFHHQTPGAEGFAVSPLKQLYHTLCLEYAAQRFGVNSFTNGARPGGIVTTETSLTQADIDRLSSELRRIHGGVDNAGKTAVLDSGLKWQAMSWDMQQAAIIDFRKLDREEVAARYLTPQSIVGILDHATFSNITEQGRWLGVHVYPPITTLLEETLQVQVIDPVPAFAKQYAAFERRELLKGDPLQQNTAYSQALNAGWLTQNEVRAFEDLPRSDDPDADRLHRPLNLTPIPEGQQLSSTPGPLKALEDELIVLRQEIKAARDLAERPVVAPLTRRRIERDATGNIATIIEETA